METQLGSWRARLLSRGGGAPCTAQGSIISYSDLFHGHIQDACGGSSPARVGYAGFLIARLSSRRVLRGGACCIGDRVPAGSPRRIGVLHF